MRGGCNPVKAAVEEYETAAGNEISTLTSHTVAWGKIWVGEMIDVLGVGDDENTGRALDIQSHLHSSFYHLIR